MGIALHAIPLGSFYEYELSLQSMFGHPPMLVALHIEPLRSRSFSPKLLGLSMVDANPAIAEAYRRAVDGGHGGMVDA